MTYFHCIMEYKYGNLSLKPRKSQFFPGHENGASLKALHTVLFIYFCCYSLGYNFLSAVLTYHLF